MHEMCHLGRAFLNQGCQVFVALHGRIAQHGRGLASRAVAASRVYLFATDSPGRGQVAGVAVGHAYCVGQ